MNGHSRTRTFVGILILVAASGCRRAGGQETTELLTTALPYPAYMPVGDDHYGHRIGPVRISYGLAQDVTYTDNANYSGSGRGGAVSDLGLSTRLNLGLFYAITQGQTVQIDFGVGYQWWMSQDREQGLNFTIAPNSHLSYAMKVGAVQVQFSNDSSTSSQASSRADFAGGTSQAPVEFNQFSNSSRVSAAWAASQRLSVSGAYSLTMSRTLNNQFGSLDRDMHSITLSPMYRVTAPFSAGIAASKSWFFHSEGIQNDGQSFSIGPSVQWRITKSVSVSGNAGYSQSTFEQTGTISDTSEFGGLNYSVSVDHALNRRINHSLSVSRSVDSGFGSNFTDLFSVQYNLGARLGQKLSPNLNVAYRQADQSGAFGAMGDLYTVGVGVGYPLLRRLNLGFNYQFNMREGGGTGANPGNGNGIDGYTENRVTLSAFFTF